jgi:hypothetical protein
LPHVLARYDSFDAEDRVLNVQTDLPIDPTSPDFDAGELHVLNRELEKLKGLGWV